MLVGVTCRLGCNVTELESFLNKLRPPDNYLKKTWTAANLKKMA